MENPDLDPAKQAGLVGRLMAARWAVRDAKMAPGREADVAAHWGGDELKRALGGRGSVWWDDGSLDLNRHRAKNTPYVDWHARLARPDHGGF